MWYKPPERRSSLQQAALLHRSSGFEEDHRGLIGGRRTHWRSLPGMGAHSRALVMAGRRSRLHGLTLLRGRRRGRPVEHGVVAILISLSEDSAGDEKHRHKCEWSKLP